VLYIIGTVAGVLSLALLAPARDAADPLAAASAHQGTVVSGAIVVLMMGLSLALIPVVLFPVLRAVNEALAVGYLVIRGAVETACYVLIAVGLLLFASLEGVTTSSDGVGSWLGDTLVRAEATNAVLTLVFCLGATLFYVALYRSRIVPRWISVWGLAAIPPYVTAALLAMYGVIEAASSGQMLMFMPLAVQEMVLAVWMIARGFRPAAAPGEPPGMWTARPRARTRVAAHQEARG
jgi:hypothetical protein